MVELVAFAPAEDHKAEVIRILEAFLADAKDGLIEDVAICAVSRSKDGAPTVRNNFHGRAHYAALIGSVSLLHSDLIVMSYQAPQND